MSMGKDYLMEYQSDSKLWKTENGRLIPIDELSNSHLLNIMYMDSHVMEILEEFKKRFSLTEIREFSKLRSQYQESRLYETHRAERHLLLCQENESIRTVNRNILIILDVCYENFDGLKEFFNTERKKLLEETR